MEAIMLAVETSGLTRVFGAVRAVDRLDLRVEAGQFYGFLGPNGAGKSTTIKMLTGLLAPSGGTMRILGVDISDPNAARAAKQRTGVVPEDLALFDNLTAREYLTFIGRMYLLSPATIRQRCDELLAMMDLNHDEKKVTLEFSHGMKKKLALAAALLPARRSHTLLGKNISLLPVALLIFLVYLGLAAFLIRPGALIPLAVAIEFGAAYLILCALGNLVSIYLPYKISAGSMKPARPKGTTHVLIILVHMLFPIFMLPLFVPPLLGLLCKWVAWMRWCPSAFAMLAGAVVLTALSALIYRLTLEPLGVLLQQREQAILQVVTQEVE